MGIVKFKQQLNPILWDKGKLKPVIRNKLLGIAKSFITSSKFITKDMIFDIWLMGSNCSYNYTKFSDIDLHIVIQFKNILKNQKILRKLFDYYTSYFGIRYKITIKGLNVQMYIQNTTQSNQSKGIYSIIKNQWIKQPNKEQSVTVDMSSIKTKYNKVKSLIKRNFNNLQNLQKVKQKIKSMRQSGLSSQGQYSVQNIVFKQLRNTGIMQTLIDRIIQLKNRKMTLQGQNLLSQTLLQYSHDDQNIFNLSNQIMIIPNVKQAVNQLQFDVYVIKTGTVDTGNLEDVYSLQKYDPANGTILYNGTNVSMDQLEEFIQYSKSLKCKHQTMFQKHIVEV